MRALSKSDKELVEEVKNYAKQFKSIHYRGEHCSSVYSAVLTTDGSVFIGPNIYHPFCAPCSICAEYSAVALAYAAGHTTIDTIVSYHYRSPKHQVYYPPCGQCREFLKLFGDPWVIVPQGHGLKKARLSELLPIKSSH